MTGFNNPVVGALNLIRKAIRSPNYVAGSAGWTVNQDGTAEFNDLTVRGKIIVQTTTEGIFVYSGAPAAGKLIVALASASGTDPYGNAYTQGVYMSGYLNGTIPNALTLQPPNVSGTDFTAAEIFTETFPTGENQTWITSPYDQAVGENAATILLRGSDRAHGDRCDIFLDAFTITVLGDLVVSNGQLHATNPSTGLVETWHTPTYGSGWGAGGAPVQGVSYRLTADNMVQFKGAALNGSAAAGQTMFTLPAGYRPPFARSALTYCRTTGSAGAFSVTTSGTVTLDVCPTGGHTFGFDGFAFSLDS